MGIIEATAPGFRPLQAPWNNPRSNFGPSTSSITVFDTNSTNLIALFPCNLRQAIDLKEWLADGQTVGPTQTDDPQGRQPVWTLIADRIGRNRQCSRAIHPYDFFSILTDPGLLDVVDQQLHAHRERLFPPTTTLSMFMAQILNADASCQAAMDRHVVERIANDLPPCSTATGAFQDAATLAVDHGARHTWCLLMEEGAAER